MITKCVWREHRDGFVASGFPLFLSFRPSPRECSQRSKKFESPVAVPPISTFVSLDRAAAQENNTNTRKILKSRGGYIGGVGSKEVRVSDSVEIGSISILIGDRGRQASRRWRSTYHRVIIYFLRLAAVQ